MALVFVPALRKHRMMRLLVGPSLSRFLFYQRQSPCPPPPNLLILSLP